MTDAPASSPLDADGGPNGPLEALELHVGALRDALQAMESRLARTERLRRADAAVISEMDARIASLEEKGTGDAEKLAKLTTAVARAQRQLDFNAEEARKSAAGLLAMIGAAPSEPDAG